MSQDDDRDFEEEKEGYHACPACGGEYDEIDYEYQICHYCHYDAEAKTYGRGRPTIHPDKDWG